MATADVEMLHCICEVVVLWSAMQNLNFKFLKFKSIQ